MEDKSYNDENDNTNSGAESLSDYEQKIVDYLIDSIDLFKSPSSVRVVEVYSYDSSEGIYYLKISGDNSLGGSHTDIYELTKRTITESYYSETSFKYSTTTPGKLINCDISRINSALKEYYTQQGWD